MARTPSRPSVLTHPPLIRADGYSPVTGWGYGKSEWATRHLEGVYNQKSEATFCRTA